MEKKRSLIINNQVVQLDDSTSSPTKSQKVRARDRRFSRISMEESGDFLQNKLQVIQSKDLSSPQNQKGESIKEIEEVEHEELENQQQQEKKEKLSDKIFIDYKGENNETVNTLPDDSMNSSVRSSLQFKTPLRRGSQYQFSSRNLIGDTQRGSSDIKKEVPENFGSQLSLDEINSFIPEKRSNGRAKKLACCIIGVPFLIILAIVSYILLRKEEQEIFTVPCNGINRDFDKECACLPNYYQKGTDMDCVGPFEEDFTPEEIKVSLAGQESNFVTRVFKKRQLEYYSYNIENVQENIVDGQIVKNSTLIQHNLGIVTQNVTDTHFNVVVFITNSTFTQGNKTVFVEGYPGITINEEDQNNNNTNNNSDSEEGVELTLWQKKVLEEEGISEEKFIISQLPIVEAKIAKNGEIVNIIYPVNLRGDIKEIFPSILNQYSPPLDTQKYNEVHSIDNNTRRRRRVLQQNETAHLNNTQKGYFTENEQPKYSADIDEQTNKASLKKQYAVNTNNTQGKDVQQETNFDQDTKVEGGRVQQSKVSAQMSLNNPDRTLEEQQNLDEVTEDSQAGVETKNLMEGMKIYQNTDFSFLKKDTLSQNFTETISIHLEINHLKNQTYEEFQAYLIEEKKYVNNQFEEKSGNVTMGTGYESQSYNILEDEGLQQDGEEDTQQQQQQGDGRRQLNRKKTKKKSKGKNDGNDNDNDRKKDKNDEDDDSNDNRDDRNISESQRNAKELIKNFKVQLFKFSLLGIDVKGFQEFWCNYGPKGSKKDICFLRPSFWLGQFSLSVKEFKFRVALAKIVRKFNYFRAKILDKIEAAAVFINEELGYLTGNSTEVIDAVNGFLNVEENGIAEDFRTIRSSHQSIMNAVYGNFTFDFNDMLQSTEKKYQGPIEKVKNDVHNYVVGFFNKIEFSWENLAASYPEAAENAVQEFVNQEKTTQVTCDIVYAIQQHFKGFSKDYLSDYKANIQRILQIKVYQPLAKFFSKLEFLPQQEEEKNNENFTKIANSIIANFVQGKVNELLDDIQEYQNNFVQNLEPKIKSAVGVVNDGLIQVIQKCNEKVDETLPHTSSEEAFLEEIIDQIHLDYFMSSSEELQNPSLGSLEKVLKTEFLQGFQQIFLEEKEHQAQIKSKLEDFNYEIQNSLAQGVFDFTTTIGKMAQKTALLIQETVTGIQGGVTGLIKSVKNLIPNLRQAIQDGNKDNGELDEALDIDSLKEQIETILELEETVNNVKELIGNAKSVPENFQIMKDFVHDMVNTPFTYLNEKELNLSKNTNLDLDFDQEDLNEALVKKFVLEKKKEVEGAMENQLEKEVQETHLAPYKESVSVSQVDLQKNMKESVFSQLTDIDSLFKRQLEVILEEFEMEKTRVYEKTLLNVELEKEFHYPTPIGIALFIYFHVGAECYVGLDLGIKGRAVEVETELGVRVTAEAQGGISVYIAKLGAYVEAVLFHGAVAVGLVLGFSKKLFGSIYAKAILYPFSITLGLFAQYRTLTFHWKCYGVGCAKICVPIPAIDWQDRFDLIDPWEYDLTDTYEKELFKFSW